MADYKVGDLSALLQFQGQDKTKLFDKTSTKPLKIPKKIFKIPKNGKDLKRKCEATLPDESRVEVSKSPDVVKPDASESRAPAEDVSAPNPSPTATPGLSASTSASTSAPAATPGEGKNARKKRRRRLENALVAEREAASFDGEVEGKRKRKTEEEEGDSEDDEDGGKREPMGKKGKEDPPDPAVSARTAFVGNLPSVAGKVLRKRLRRLFSGAGPVESVRLRGFVGEDPKMSKRGAAISNKLNSKVDTIHAYVVFENAADADKAVEDFDGTEFEGRHLRVDVCGKEANLADSKLSVFVGNLPYDVSDEALHKLFRESFGDVARVRVVRDKSTRMGKGFGYVAFRSLGAVVAAVREDEKMELAGRTLRIKRAKSGGGGGGGVKKFMGDLRNKKTKTKRGVANWKRNAKSRKAFKKKNTTTMVKL